MFKTLLPTLACLAALAACSPAMTRVPDSPPPTPSRGSCEAAQAQSFVGQKASAQVQAQARSAAGAGSVRTLQPGQAITKEFNGERLNLYVDEANTVIRVSCG